MSSKHGRKTRKDPKTKTPVHPEHRAFATALLPLLPPGGFLLWVTVRPPQTVRIPTLHLAVARFFASQGCDYVAAMDWEKCEIDAACRRGEGEHVHAIVRLPVPVFHPFCGALYAWAEKHGIFAKAVDVQFIRGWPRYLGVGDRTELIENVTKTFAYAMKPPKNGRTRDLETDVVANGRFVAPWEAYVAAKKTDQRGLLQRACKFCRRPLLEGTTRREHCDDSCRRKYNRLLKRTSFRFVFKDGDVYVHRHVRARGRPGCALSRTYRIA